MIDLEIYSPVQQLQNPLYKQKHVRVFIKRDDLIHPYISGNKWRKLKYTLHKAVTENKKHLVTFGGAYSNHLLASACAGAKFGFKTTGIVRGEAVSNSTLVLCTLFGMKLIFIDRETYKNKHLYFSRNFSADSQAFFIDEGGAGPEAVKGCAELVNELGETFDYLFCASGTGTTAAGILSGLQQHQLKTMLHAVPVLKNGSFIKDEILKYVSPACNLQLHLDYHFGGYAKTEPRLIEFIKMFSAETGILLDPVYTGKLFFAVHDLIRADYFPPGSSILAVHTGGLLGILGMQEKFQSSF